MSEREISHFFGGTHEDDTPQPRINIEEGLDCRKDNMRFFSMINQDTKLGIVISHDSSILSCNISGHEIVIDKTNLRQPDREASCLDDQAPLRVDRTSWNCHVRGPELSFTSNNSMKIYELKSSNELNCIVKLRTFKIQNKPTYFNLNNAKDMSTIEGHSISIQCNGNMNRIKAQHTRCTQRDRPSTLPISLIGEIPLQLVTNRPRPHLDQNSDDAQENANLIICDSIYSLEATNSLDYLRVQLQYLEKSVEFEIRSSSNLPNNQSSSINGSTGQGASSSSSSSSNLVDMPQERKSVDIESNDVVTNSNNCDNPVDNSASSNFKTTLKLRVRVTNFGVAMMPILMKNYICKFKFVW